jgi:hypothetical protein
MSSLTQAARLASPSGRSLNGQEYAFECAELDVSMAPITALPRDDQLGGFDPQRISFIFPMPHPEDAIPV